MAAAESHWTPLSPFNSSPSDAVRLQKCKGFLSSIRVFGVFSDMMFPIFPSLGCSSGEQCEVRVIQPRASNISDPCSLWFFCFSVCYIRMWITWFKLPRFVLKYVPFGKQMFLHTRTGILYGVLSQKRHPDDPYFAWLAWADSWVFRTQNMYVSRYMDLSLTISARIIQPQ